MNRKEILRDNTVKVNDTVNVHFEVNCILYEMPKLKRESGKKKEEKNVPGGVFYIKTLSRPIKFCAPYKYKSPSGQNINFV